ncbi:MAG: dTMP kinase [Candidatus Terrybacteria bacterium RIFCSPLOWO2_01_FULL_44_24]|uniref:Thymidylate kinase n=1 Tax=Candidatus Terrybacteria bacterium RIFCSPHIGHO2_01_FULL_43_35 TaxID=1802361 RepID=A0A1G2PD69_9BACT|nr:MAG: dTMP kinase [Candidatus Terrybacteria bacterium RIFCSPHIGHO2_01_FULL_43_35]OHA50205.1 MAG: dTMP kinase [Candidatus Terrybacteria bacterium RIFCSPHIGHO2_02_FULL_43_14]OHA51264.1 MAG: dTMP kinase [Candidatus Terrybacteria bacterium RIFCSPLOWO2_01_FULL_44_24]
MRTNPYPGFFIVLEGIDRSGKHTQGQLISAYLRQQGAEALFTHEPWWGNITDNDRRLERIIKNEETASVAEIQKLFIDNRRRHLTEEINPKLNRAGRSGSEESSDSMSSKSRTAVVCERYFLSTLAYGIATNAASFDELLKTHETMEGFILPDLTLLFDISAKVAIQRLGPKADVFEKEPLLEVVRSQYISLANLFSDATTVIIDGTGSEDEVFTSLLPYLEKAIREKYGQKE